MQVRVQEDPDEFGKCGCGRSPTGKCIGWHALSEEEWKEKLAESVKGLENRIKVKMIENRIKGRAPFENKKAPKPKTTFNKKPITRNSGRGR